MQRTILNPIYLLIVVGGFFFSCLAQVSSTDIKNMSEKADIIITGKVIQQKSSWNEDKSRIYTNATIQIEEYLKGNNSESSVVVRYLGGEVGDVGELYSHMPKFEDKEEVLVFLTKDEQNSNYKVFNGADGKINIVEDQKTGEKITASNVKINSFKAQIKSYINEQ
jgi:hypothetical protein